MNNNLPERKKLKLRVEIQDQYKSMLLEAAAIVVNHAHYCGETDLDYGSIVSNAWLLLEEIAKVADIKAIETVEFVDEAYAEAMLEES